MTTKRTKRKAPTRGLGSLEGPVILDGFVHFGEKDLLRYELAQHKVVNALQGIGLKKRELEQLRVEAEQRIKACQVEIADLTLLAKKEENNLRLLQEDLQAEYNLDFAQVTYDDVSGKVMLLGEPVRT